MSSAELIQSEFRDGIMTIRMNRPDKKNALNGAMYLAIAGSLQEADRTAAVRVILICGSGECFTSGYDLADLADLAAAPEHALDGPAMRFLSAISEARKPIVAAVNGVAVGVGVTMLLHCDLVYAGESATFQVPFVNLGLCPEAGSTLLLPRMMGHQRAAELLLLGESFSADKACAVGIVTAVCPDGEVAGCAWGKSLLLAAQPPAAVRLTKSLLKRENAGALREATAREGAQFVERLGSPEAAEALQAFRERRKPDFSRFE